MAQQQQVKRASFDVRDVDIANEIRDLEQAAIYAQSTGQAGKHEALSSQIADKRADQRLNAAARDEFDRRSAASARERALELNAARVAAGERVDVAIAAFVDELDAYFAVSHEQQTALAEGGLDALVSDARPVTHEVLGALLHAAQGRRASGLELPGIPASDHRPLADADRALAERVVEEARNA